MSLKLDKSARKLLTNCCGSSKWVKGMLKARPFKSLDQAKRVSNQVWAKCKEKDFLEAFTHHPKIGDLKSLEKKFQSTKKWAGNEQAGVNKASSKTIKALAKGNADYEKKFGFIFIVCATGKSAQEMLDILNSRIGNSYKKELRIAAGEQAKITEIRLNKLFEENKKTMSQITTHVLDTSKGKPAKDLAICLFAQSGTKWKKLASGLTNKDGRISDLLKEGKTLEPGIYKMVFDTAGYFKNKKTFYPEVSIVFETFDKSHYHVPLLLNPFGYSTYRGS